MNRYTPSMWAPDEYLVAYDAWQAGWGDLPFAAGGRSVPAMVQLGVLAHAPWRRLDDLRRAPRWGRAVHAWGGDVLSAVDRLLTTTSSAGALTRMQQAVLQPIERRLLDGGRVDLSRGELLAVLDRTALSPRAAARNGAEPPPSARRSRRR
jgi:hypothetical protein